MSTPTTTCTNAKLDALLDNPGVTAALRRIDLYTTRAHALLATGKHTDLQLAKLYAEAVNLQRAYLNRLLTILTTKTTKK